MVVDIIVDHRPLLIERDIAGAVNADGEHDGSSRASAADHHTRFKRQDDLLAAKGIEQPGRPGIDAHGVADRSRGMLSVGAIADCKRAADRTAIIDVERGVIGNQDWLGGLSFDDWRIVFDCDRNGAAESRDLAIADADRNNKASALFAARVWMIHRTQQGGRVRPRIVDDERNDRVAAGGASQRVAVGADGPGYGHALGLEVGRQPVREKGHSQRVAVRVGYWKDA